MTTNHTPTPWAVDVTASKHRIVAKNKTIAALPDNGSPLGMQDLRDGVTQANAAFIVRACNAHDELVAALRELLAQAERDPFMTVGHFVEHVIGARAALAKVQA